jgi:hypothetical protein
MMATSGHISAQRAQPVHFSGFEKTATVYPILFGAGLKVTSFCGQAIVQSPHPLQRDSIISIFGIFSFPGIIYRLDKFQIWHKLADCLPSRQPFYKKRLDICRVSMSLSVLENQSGKLAVRGRILSICRSIVDILTIKWRDMQDGFEANLF